MKHNLTWILALAMLAAAGAKAQTPLALTNIGQPLQNEDARMVGRGGWGMAVDDSTHPGFKNLASLYGVRKVALSFSAFGDRTESEDASGTRTTSRVFTPDFRVALPLLKGRLAVTAGFVADRSSQYDTSVDSTWSAWSDTISGKVQFLRDGSVFRVPIGVAFALRSGVSLAASLNLQHGTLRESFYNLLQDPASLTGVPLYQTNLLVQEDTYSGQSATFAALLRPSPRFRLGASYTPAYDLDVSRKIEMGGVTQRARSNLVYSIPAEYRTGVSLVLAGRWRMGMDYQYQDFQDFSGEDAWSDAMDAEHTLSLGVEKVRAHARHGGWGNLPLRLGFRSRTWAYHVGGSPVKEETFSVGTGFPFRGDLGQMDVALSYSLVGNLDDNGMRSRILRLTLSVTGLERWW